MHDLTAQRNIITPFYRHTAKREKIQFNSAESKATKARSTSMNQGRRRGSWDGSAPWQFPMAASSIEIMAIGVQVSTALSKTVL